MGVREEDKNRRTEEWLVESRKHLKLLLFSSSCSKLSSVRCGCKRAVQAREKGASPVVQSSAAAGFRGQAVKQPFFKNQTLYLETKRLYLETKTLYLATKSLVLEAG